MRQIPAIGGPAHGMNVWWLDKEPPTVLDFGVIQGGIAYAYRYRVFQYRLPNVHRSISVAVYEGVDEAFRILCVKAWIEDRKFPPWPDPQ